MKFESITMHNFMRYKGVNRIDFSCDGEKNVTVVLGDNTVGKTTIAQAFRWGLYGNIMMNVNRGRADYQLLNNDILELMDANNRASVKVEIAAVDEEKRYIITRETVYTRAFPKLEAREFQKKLSMKITDLDDLDSFITVEDQEIGNLIRELFPVNLSHYFLFDGERWNDVSIGGVKENIKESVHILTGLSAYQAAMHHLKDMGSNSVIRKFRSKISGSGAVYDNLREEQGKIERRIETLKNEIKTSDINIQNYEQKYQEIERFLEQNKNTEQLQAKKHHLEVLCKSQKDRSLTNYRMLVNAFSEKAFMLFSEPLIDACLQMLKETEVERRDIPYMRQATIDYLIQGGKCICGNPIHEDNEAFTCLMELRKYLYPADIGSILGDFERSANRWKWKTTGIRKDLLECAKRADDSIREYNDTLNSYVALEKSLDEHIDFAEKKDKQRFLKKEMERFSREKGEKQGQIESYRKRYYSIEKDMETLEAKDAENRRWRSRLELAEELYKKLEKEFSAQEKRIFMELNQQIQENFSRMFNAKDKKIELTPNYDIQMLYRTNQGYREEKNLSEGEKIARNFAFIVTIMDFSRKKKAERAGMEMEESDTLPIVLDGPFSKLGDENIELIAKVLPEVSEQVIIFMLKKDWAYTKLDDYVGCAYSIEKKADESFASIQKMEGGVA